MDEMLIRLSSGEPMTYEDAKRLHAAAVALGMVSVFDEATRKLAERSMLIDARNKERAIHGAVGKQQKARDNGQEVVYLARYLIGENDYSSIKCLAADIRKELDFDYSIKSIERRLKECEFSLNK